MTDSETALSFIQFTGASLIECLKAIRRFHSKISKPGKPYLLASE